MYDERMRIAGYISKHNIAAIAAGEQPDSIVFHKTQPKVGRDYVHIDWCAVVLDTESGAIAAVPDRQS